MDDPRTYLLTVTNIALGAVVVVLILTVVGGALWDWMSRLTKRVRVGQEIDRDMRRWFHDPTTSSSKRTR